jgi:cytochrome c oxidase cbb3-type subunit III
MVPWKDQLSPGELTAMAAYVLTLHATHPPNPKAPQGVKIAAAETPARR